MERTIPVDKFQAHCLQLMDDVREKHLTLVITKQGIPVAKLVPIETSSINLFGALKGSMVIKEDIGTPIENKWGVEL